MSKDRLEEIKEQFEYGIKNNFEDYNVALSDVQWLIEQAERVDVLRIALNLAKQHTSEISRDLRGERDDARNSYKRVLETAEILKEENDGLREALLNARHEITSSLSLDVEGLNAIEIIDEALEDKP